MHKDTFKFEGKEHRVFDLETPFGSYRVFLVAGEYTHGGTLAVEMYCIDEEGWEEPFSTLTVNLAGFPGQDADHAFLDTNNNGFVLSFLTKHGLAEHTGYFGQSGYCTYPLMEFHKEKFTVPANEIVNE